MQKEMVELVFILDRSGSMNGLESDTIGGFNGMLAKQKKEEGEARVTTILFDDQYEVLHDGTPIQEVNPISEEQYYVGGCTALLDAVGRTIQRIIHVQKHSSGAFPAKKVIFVIITDGLENASKEYRYHTLKQIIDEQKKSYGWEFIFMGANMDAIKEAKKLGIEEDRAVSYQNDEEGIALNYEVMADTIKEMRRSSDRIDGEWKKQIERDWKERGKAIVKKQYR